MAKLYHSHEKIMNRIVQKRTKNKCTEFVDKTKEVEKNYQSLDRLPRRTILK